MFSLQTPSGVRLFAACAVIVPVLASCGTAPRGDGALGVSDEALTGAATCPASTTYGLIKFVDPRTPPECAPVAGAHGEWLGSTEYLAQACEATRDPKRGAPVFCTYEWKPQRRHPNAAPDDVALESIPDVFVAPFGSGGENTCQEPSALPHEALLDEAGVTCPTRPGHPDGPAACTVCGTKMRPGVRRDALALPATSTLRTLVVGLSNGTERVVTFDIPAESAARNGAPGSYVEIALPSLPPELRYVEGPASGYGYGHEHP